MDLALLKISLGTSGFHRPMLAPGELLFAGETAIIVVSGTAVELRIAACHHEGVDATPVLAILGAVEHIV